MSSYQQLSDLPQAMRRRYLESLPEPQEWFLEDRVRSGEAWDFFGEGYAVFDGDTLVEFYAENAGDAHLHMSNLIRQRPFRKILCKSFDHVVMTLANENGWTLVETGFLFRKRNRVALKKTETFQLAKARPTDLNEAWKIGGDFYDSKDEVDQIFRSNGLWIGFNDGQMVGNGVTIPVDGSGHVVDVGMVTRRSQRNKGFASLIVAELADLLERNGKRPICGCAESNLASKAALEKAGFVSEHRLVQITIPD